jgi:hypothetical protein
LLPEDFHLRKVKFSQKGRVGVKAAIMKKGTGKFVVIFIQSMIVQTIGKIVN